MAEASGEVRASEEETSLDKLSAPTGGDAEAELEEAELDISLGVRRAAASDDEGDEDDALEDEFRSAEGSAAEDLEEGEIPPVGGF